MMSETHVEQRLDGIREVLILSLECLHVHVRGDEGQQRIEVVRAYLQVRVLDGRCVGSVGGCISMQECNYTTAHHTHSINQLRFNTRISSFKPTPSFTNRYSDIDILVEFLVFRCVRCHLIIVCIDQVVKERNVSSIFRRRKGRFMQTECPRYSH